MRQLTYALRFTGRATPAEAGVTLIAASTTAPRCAAESALASADVCAWAKPATTGESTLETEVIFTGETTFQQVGTIRFGDGPDRLRFSTLGSGYLGSSPDPALRHGTAMWQVDGGEGRFAGASGLITSNFTIDGDGGIDDRHLSVIYLA